MRKSFRETFALFANYEGAADLSQLNEVDRQLYKSAINPSIHLFAFSDSITIYIPLKKEESGLNVPISGIHGILGAAGMISLIMLAAGHPIRGGIDVGIAFEIGNDEVYGPALARAYSLESNVSQYPRITIGEELIQYLQINATQKENGDRVKSVEKTLAKQCAKFIAVDDDGIPFIDYLGEDFLSNLPDNSRELTIAAYQFVVSKSIQYKKEKNSKLAFRYSLLRNYFESRLSLGKKAHSD